MAEEELRRGVAWGCLEQTLSWDTAGSSVGLEIYTEHPQSTGNDVERGNKGFIRGGGGPGSD